MASTVRGMHVPRLLSTALAALVLAACGGDEEPAPPPQRSTTAAPTAAPTTSTTPQPTGSTGPDTASTPAPGEGGPSTEQSGGTPAPSGEDEPGTGGAAAPSPEEQEGGAGDEQGASTAVALRGRGGEVTPARVEVPPYIAVRVSLRAADAGSYALTVRGRTLRAGGSLTLDGLTPGSRYVLRAAGGGGRVEIVPSSEPGR